MRNLWKGVVAGLVAAYVLCGVMYATKGYVSGLGIIDLLARVTGWGILESHLAYFAAGAFVWGAPFAILAGKLPGAYWQRGLIFGFCVWLVAALLAASLPGAGLAGHRIGLNLTAYMLALHMIFGAVLGGAYAMLAE